MTVGSDKGVSSNVMQQSERQISQQILDAIESSVLLDRYPKAVISINVVMLQSSGGELAAAITAVSLALVDAGIEVRDIVTACSVLRTWNTPNNEEGKGEQSSLLLDPSQDELKRAELDRKCFVTIAAMTALKEITTTHSSGRFSQHTLADMITTGLEGCTKMRKLISSKVVSNHVTEKAT